MFADIPFIHFVPFSTPVAIALDKQMARRAEEGLLRRLTDWSLIVDVLGLLQELPLVFRDGIHTPSRLRRRRFQQMGSDNPPNAILAGPECTLDARSPDAG
jgi:hypothetical protein